LAPPSAAPIFRQVKPKPVCERVVADQCHFVPLSMFTVLEHSDRESILGRPQLWK
jgi:hypothetical protein